MWKYSESKDHQDWAIEKYQNKKSEWKNTPFQVFQIPVVNAKV